MDGEAEAEVFLAGILGDRTRLGLEERELEEMEEEEEDSLE